MSLEFLCELHETSDRQAATTASAVVGFTGSGGFHLLLCAFKYPILLSLGDCLQP
jgi:hypothetical protein